MDKKVVIIGGVAGGATAAARLRRLSEATEIIMIERGSDISYANCGLPYYVGDVIKSRDALFVQTPKTMRDKFNIDVRTLQEVTQIDREAKTVTVRNLQTEEIYTETYDVLVLSTGSSPLRPPIPGIDGERILTLWNVADTDRIKESIGGWNVKTATVVGGGFIGLEMAENLHGLGIQVTLVEMLDQVMAPLDFEMAQLLHENLRQNGVDLRLGDGVSTFENKEGSVLINLSSGNQVEAELVILSIGVRPNNQLSKAAGLELNARGGVVTDNEMRTSDPNIYAVGDLVQVEDFISKEPTMIPLAGPASKQGRIVADNIAGAHEEYKGTQGTSVAQVFDLTAASTGANEKALIRQGLVKGKDYQTLIINQNSHASYYPGATPMRLKMIFSMDGKKIYGAQIVGIHGVDKRIDTLATAIRLNASTEDLKYLELAYAPPYSSAKDPVNMAGFVAENVLKGMVVFADWDYLEKHPDAVRLDVGEEAERMAFAMPDSIHIPLGQLRERMGELDKDADIVMFCNIGVRSYNGARVLMQNGFKNIKLYPAGSRFYRSTHYQNFQEDMMPIQNERQEIVSGGPAPIASVNIDCSGMQCPGPLMKVNEAIGKMVEGEVLEVTASDPGFTRDIGAWTRTTGNRLLSNEKRGNEYVAVVQKGMGEVVMEQAVRASGKDGKTIIVFSGDLDKVLASFIIANGAAAMGRPVTMFFTFWGLNVLRKAQSQKVEKSFIEAMFGGMMPRGAGKLKLSKMNMGGMGTAMMRKVMRDKNVDSLEELIRKAMEAGVKIVACTMSMDVMGIKEEELIPGVELGGVGAYLGDAEESNVNLFI
ncbi:MAG: DsrE/DsrF/DrsH-like family protein [Eubacteriales bacterium]|nr:DsrE/DsrF/DrsH-like family protein [Eubacteriales bacterium]